MSSDNKDSKLSLTVMLNKERNKVLYAVADNNFADILLSFMTLQLGRVVKILEKHYGKEASNIGSLNSLYHGIANLDSAHFVTEGAKQLLLNPTSSFESEYEELKLDFTDPSPAEYFICSNCNDRFRSVSIYYDRLDSCLNCKGIVSKEVVQKRSTAASSDGVFTKQTAYFLISNDLHILPKEAGFLQIIRILGINEMDMEEAEAIEVTIGFNEIMRLLKASLTSPTPLSDLILHKKTQISSSPIMDSQLKGDDQYSWRFILKAIIQKSSGKFLYAQTKQDFVEFLVSLLFIPLAGVDQLMAGNTCFKAIRNLYRSATDLIDYESFKTWNMKSRLMSLYLTHGCISTQHILPLIQEPLPVSYNQLKNCSPVKFPKGEGSYLQRPRTYLVKDDLTVLPYCFVSILSSLREQKILISDVEQVELRIGLNEALSILKASLTSTSALSDVLLTQMSNKIPKREL